MFTSDGGRPIWSTSKRRHLGDIAIWDHSGCHHELLTLTR
jgi:hypothetical protein